MRTSAKWLLGLSAVGLVIAAVVSNSDNGGPGGVSDNDTLDYSKPFLSVDGMTTCRDVSAFSKIASDLHDHFTPKYAEYGCRTWPDGIPVTVIAKIAAYRHVEFADVDGTRVSDFTLFTMLRNAASPSSAPAPAQVPTPSQPAGVAETMSAEVSALRDKEEKLNEKCRDGRGDDPATFKACDDREAVLAALKDKGWCWLSATGVGADADWTRCPASQH